MCILRTICFENNIPNSGGVLVIGITRVEGFTSRTPIGIKNCHVPAKLRALSRCLRSKALQASRASGTGATDSNDSIRQYCISVRMKCCVYVVVSNVSHFESADRMNRLDVFLFLFKPLGLKRNSR